MTPITPTLTLTLASQQDVNVNEAAKSIAKDKIETSEVWWPYCRGLKLPLIITLNPATQLMVQKATQP